MKEEMVLVMWEQILVDIAMQAGYQHASKLVYTLKSAARTYSNGKSFTLCE